MGLDFIRDKSGKPWRKKWAGGVERLKIPGLFDLPIDDAVRTVMVVFKDGARAELGEELVAHVRGRQLDVCRGVTIVGTALNPPEDILNMIVAAGGVAEAPVVRLDIFGTAAEVQLK